MADIVLCKDCKFFEEDFWGDIDGAPLIVAHEICTRWGRGCKTQRDGFCHMAEIKDGIDETRKVLPADVVEVVRCKDCEYCYSDGYCPEIERDVDALFFCENGLRKWLGGEDIAT